MPANHMKDYYGATFPTENTPPERWLSSELSPKPMITHSPKQLEQKNAEIDRPRIPNRDMLNGGGSGSFDLDLSHSRSPDYHYISTEHRHSLSERSYSHHSDPGYLRKDLSQDLGSPPHHRPPAHLTVTSGVGPSLNNGIVTSVNHLSDDNISGIATPPCSLSNSQNVSYSTPSKGNEAAIHANAHVGTARVGMKLEVTNIWLGTVTVKPAEPIIVHENGVKIHLVHRDKGVFSQLTCKSI